MGPKLKETDDPILARRRQVSREYAKRQRKLTNPQYYEKQARLVELEANGKYLCSKCGFEGDIKTHFRSFYYKDKRCSDCILKRGKEWRQESGANKRYAEKRRLEVDARGRKKPGNPPIFGPPPPARLCKKCNETKLIEEFGTHPKCSFGYTHTCLVCEKIAARLWFEKNKKVYTEKRLKYRQNGYYVREKELRMVRNSKLKEDLEKFKEARKRINLRKNMRKRAKDGKEPITKDFRVQLHWYETINEKGEWYCRIHEKWLQPSEFYGTLKKRAPYCKVCANKMMGENAAQAAKELRDWYVRGNFKALRHPDKPDYDELPDWYKAYYRELILLRRAHRERIKEANARRIRDQHAISGESC